jgi:hypothetical protein
MSLTALRLACALVLASALAGCGAGSAALQPTPRAGPHGGALVGLPAGGGYGEVVLESSSPRARDVKFVAYFLGPDLSGPATTLPTDVQATLEFPDGSSMIVGLAPEPQPKDTKGGAGRFASRPGPYDVDPPIGELSGTVGGQSFSGKFAGPR